MEYGIFEAFEYDQNDPYLSNILDLGYALKIFQFIQFIHRVKNVLRREILMGL